MKVFFIFKCCINKNLLNTLSFAKKFSSIYVFSFFKWDQFQAVWLRVIKGAKKVGAFIAFGNIFLVPFYDLKYPCSDLKLVIEFI